MTDTKSRPRRRESVGGEGPKSAWQPIFLVSVLAVAVSIIVLVMVTANSVSDNGGGVPTLPGGGATDTPTTGPDDTPAPGETPSETPNEPTATPTLNADGAIIVECLDILAPVDKTHRLTEECVPPDLVELPASRSAQGSQYLRAEAADALLRLFDAAEAEAGYVLSTNSSYRSYQTQRAVYDSAVAAFGREYADRTSARPGHSEHQMGTTADVGARGRYLENFTGTPEAEWIAENSWRFGFIVSYPDGKEHITGYAYEPWHIRYVGEAVAQQVFESGLTLHEFLLQ
jgi:zinc D-Ala-D-Ala carboxypeptidase